MVEFDRAAMLWVCGYRRPWLITAFRLVTWTGTGRAWAVFSLMLFVLEALRVHVVPAQATFLRTSLCALLAWGAARVVKRAVGRQRPSQVIVDYESAVPTPECGSFPSAHAAASIAFFVGLALLHHPLAGAVGAWALTVALSRFFLGVHFPTDLAGGAVLGSACGCIVLVAKGFW